MLLEGMNTDQVGPRGSTDKSGRVQESPGSDCYTEGKRSYTFPTGTAKQFRNSTGI